MRKLTIALAASALACAACSILPAPDRQTDRLGYGRHMYERKCQQCHELYDPREYSQRGLDRALRRYAPRAGLQREDRPYVLEYLLANARDAR